MPEDDSTPLSHADRARAAEPDVIRWLVGRPPSSPEAELRDLADVAASLDEPARWDRYGEHGPVAVLERRVAELLGKPAVAMFPSGVMAQQSMLRVWCDASGRRRVAMPALSHLLTSEADGPRLLHGFDVALLTDGPTVPGADDLAAIPGPLGAALLELPLRSAGFLLPSWDGLVAFSEACRSRGVPLHLDGARLWESAPYLGHTPAEVAALADSVYVSFYKGLGGLSGAAVAGPEEQVAQVRLWRTRMGGTLFSLLPYALAALRGLDRELPRMAEYHERAVILAERLAAHGIRDQPFAAAHQRLPHPCRARGGRPQRATGGGDGARAPGAHAALACGRRARLVVDRVRGRAGDDAVGRRRGGRDPPAGLRRVSLPGGLSPGRRRRRSPRCRR